MLQYNFPNANTGNKSSSLLTTLVANAAVATVATFDVRDKSKLSATVAVGVAALTAMNISARTDALAAWMPLPRTELAGYGRTDASTDIGTTPAAASAAIQLDVSYWAEVKIECSSAGAATTSVTASVG